MKALLITKTANIKMIKNSLVINENSYLPNEIDFTDIFIDRQDGYISMKALRFLVANNVNLHIMHYSGTVIGTFTPIENIDGKVKLAQFEAYTSNKEAIANAILQAKLKAQHNLLLQLSKRYPISTEYTPHGKKLISIEGDYANFYFKQLGIVFNTLAPEFHFVSRNNNSHNIKAQDPINAMLNFAYSILQALTLKHINYYGLLPDISFLHELHNSKHSLAFDLMEFSRPIADLAVIKTLESKKLSWDDFAYSELKTCRLNPSAQHFLLANLQVLLNMNVEGRQLETYHKENIKAFTDSLSKKKLPSFKVITPPLYESESVIERLRNMGIAERKKLGINKNTLWYIQKNLANNKPVKIYSKILAKL